jgi:hypothetical protein
VIPVESCIQVSRAVRAGIGWCPDPRQRGGRVSGTRGYAWRLSSSASDRFHRIRGPRHRVDPPGITVAEQYSATPITS